MDNPFTFAPGEDVYFLGAYDLTNEERAKIIEILGRSKATGTFTYDTEANGYPEDSYSAEDYWNIYYQEEDSKESFYVEYDDEVRWYLEKLPSQEARDTMRKVFEYLLAADHIGLFGEAAGDDYF